MVDAVVSFAVQRLGDFLIQQATFLLGVEDEVKWLKTELKMMQSLLGDAAEKQDGDQRIRQWISDVRDVAYDTEDVIDNFILVERTHSKRELFASVKKCSCICFCKKEIRKEVDLYSISKEIEALRKRVVEISRRRGDYGIKNIGDGGEVDGAIESLRHLRRTSPFADEEHVVGFEDVAALLVDELLKKEPRRCVISIFGMGGLGKTTLARKLYRDSRVIEGKFEHRGWVYVSQEYRIGDLLQRIIKSFKQYLSKEELEILEKMTEEDLERYLHDLLTGSRYLVVIDDVWDRVAWESLMRAFPDNKNGSRVIVTTRIKAVAELPDKSTHAHELRFLSSEESWELFCKKAFPNQNTAIGDTSRCPSDLEMLGREMVTKCSGLPLAIIVLGGLLSRKRVDEWWKVKEHIWRDLRDGSIHISQLLTLSFNDLHYRLKPCFLYLGLLPEDSLIDTERLVRLWVAEGFIPPGEETLEQIAEDWLNELIGRSLIQVVKRSWRRIRICRVHDLLRDLAVKRAKELNFLHIYDGNINSASSYRRQAAHSRIERYVSVDYSNPSLRTLLFFNSDTSPSNIQQLTIIHRRFKLLRVLDLHSIRFDNEFSLSLPDAVGELIHLRYLGLKNTKINTLPPSIFKLQALQTLDASTPDTIVSLQGDIRRLKQLRHLIGRFGRLLQVDQLTNLQTLRFINTEDWIEINPVNLINLRDLHMMPSGQAAAQHMMPAGQVAAQEKEFTMEPVANLRNLQSLLVQLCSSMYISSFEPLSHCRHLLQLMINGRIKENLPERMHEYLPNLKYLQLRESQLNEDPMPTLEKLSNLMILDFQSSVLMKLSFTAKGFPRLEVLRLGNLPNLKELQVEEGSMPMLKCFTRVWCAELVVPERLRLIPEDNYSLNWDW